MLRFLVPALVVALIAACQEPDPRYGDPGGIVGQGLPNEVASGGADGKSAFGGPFDANANKPAKSMLESHKGTAGPQAAADTINCLTCHVTGGTVPAPEFAFGGRITAKEKPLPGADVMVMVGDKKVGPVKSDADGFFWSPGTALPKDGQAFVRNADGERKMNQPLGAAAAGGGCDSESCHVTGKQGKINI